MKLQLTCIEFSLGPLFSLWIGWLRPRHVILLLESNKKSDREAASAWLGPSNVRNYWWSKPTASEVVSPTEPSSQHTPEPVVQAKAATSPATPEETVASVYTPSERLAQNEAIVPTAAPTSESISEVLPADMSASASEVVANVIPSLQYGDFAALGITSWWPSGIMSWTFELLQVSTGMSWFYTIIAGTLFWRAVLIPTALTSMRNTARLRPYADRIKILDEQAQGVKDRAAQMEIMLKKQKLMENAGVSLRSMFLPPVIQMVGNFGLFFAVRNMVQLPVVQLTQSGVWFLPDLTLTGDYIMPTLVLLAMNVQFSVMKKELDPTKPVMAHTMNVMRVATFATLPMMSWMPTGLWLSMLTGMLLSITQSSLLRVPRIRQVLAIPPMTPMPPVTMRDTESMSLTLGSISVQALDAVPSGTPVPEEEEFYSSWSLFLVCLLLILSLWTSYYLQIKRIRAIHETLVSIFAGMFVGLVVRLAPGTMIREMLTFKHTLFFNLLLPPIILNSGYELKQENFFRNFGSILTFAFLGTAVSAMGVGVLVYIYSFLGLESLDVTLLECLIFGSTLSATDPVTILAIFQQYKVDPKLYTIIFGESLLNDAVSIVMYETLTQFHGTEIFLSSIFHGIGIFLLSFSVSMALGVSFGLAMSLVLKHSSLSLYPSIESCLVALCAYTCYFFSNGLSMSGIVSLLFCGITLKHYAYHTMSRRTQRTTKYIFSTLAQLSENFIFIYLGLSLFTSPPSSERVTNYVKPLFIAVTTVAVVFTRYAAVFPLSEAINFFTKHARGQRNEELSHSYQMMLFWAGLRGAVGVALAAGFKGDNAQTLRITVLVVVVLTVIVFGGTTARMLEILGIRTGVEDEAASSSDEDGPPGRVSWSNRRTSGGWHRHADDAVPYFSASQQGYGRAAGRIGTHYAPRSYNHHTQAQSPSSPVATNVFSVASSDSFDSDAEVLPMAATTSGDPEGHRVEASSHGQEQESVAVGEDGKWFQTLDERYLLPLFSNATASRTFHARRARRNASLANIQVPGVTETPHDSEDEPDSPAVDLTAHGSTGTPPREFLRTPSPEEQSRSERGLGTPTLRNGAGREDGQSRQS
ncbi:Sodium/hydrogen exchanger family-domain-containing protein [Lanmaoa asiatica]|nr:Sodium/hydrogen exchanger family-domain-containing protein [Lanmaoa asiatica]